MAQLAIYIDDQLAERLDQVVKISGKSKSRWVSDVLREILQNQWPEGFFELAGSWKGNDEPEEIIKMIRQGIGKNEDREDIQNCLATC